MNHIELDVSYEFINMKAGIEIPRKEVDGILGRLGFEASVVSATGDSQYTPCGYILPKAEQDFSFHSK